MFKKLVLLLCTCCLLSFSALAEDWLVNDNQPQAMESVTEKLTYDAADTAGTVVNMDAPDEPTQEEWIQYSVTPLEVVLVLDSSGSMGRSNPLNNKTLLSYAQDAAIAFGKTLYAVNPASRISVVAFESGVRTISDFQGIGSQNALNTAIRQITLGGNTYTGGGYERATALLNEQAMANRQRVVLLLSDGQANVGGSDPLQYTVDQGRLAAAQSKVYTIGLVGGMGDSERRYTREILSAGYETRYVEVDFDEVSDMTTELTSAFMSIAMCGNMDEESVGYRLWIDGDMDFRVENSRGEYLSSTVWDYADTSSFGSFLVLGDTMDEKMVILRGDDYRITLHGSATGTARYTLTQLRGSAAIENTLIDTSVQTHPALCQTVAISGGSVKVTDESYEPLDIYAIDPFTGKRTNGLEIAALGMMSGDEVSVRPMPSNDAGRICRLAENTVVRVLAKDSAKEFYYISFVDDNDQANRGWVKMKYVDVEGYVPEMVWLSGVGVIDEDVTSHRLPSATSSTTEELDAGDKVEIRHAERDVAGNEWLYVQPEDEDAYVYIPASTVENWTEQTGEGFRIEYAVPQYVWQTVFGGGYTEVMWAASQTDGAGVVLSGRTTSERKPFSNNEGGRDAFALRLGSDGSIEKAVTAGGSAVDSYHCILPVEDGYYVSGITRSNNGDFAGTWDASSRTGGSSKTTNSSNALIGKLDGNFSISWLKTFGPGNASYGFDTVIQLADGNIAGTGWMTDSSKGTLYGYGKQDFYVVKMTPDGQILKAACFGSGVNDVPDSAIATPDGGLIMVGMHRRNGAADGWILVLDANLNVVSDCSYGGSGEDVFDNVRMLSDGTYLVTGFTNSPSGNGVGDSKGGTDFWAMNIDRLGRSIWVKRYGGSGDEELCGTTVMADGTCVLVGSTTSTDGDVLGSRAKSQDAWSICIDESGRLLWQYASGMSGNDAFNAAAVDPQDGGYVLAGLCKNSSDDKAQGFAVKLQPVVKMD